ncbi:MAG: winged helix-turn-helix domain-containing protein [Acidobacteria bacterium]|nr:winged helix-turn-helix domain-containing protein [Acidobacteriota bacterium]
MRVIRVDDEVWRALQKKAMPFEDTPNSVLRRILKTNGLRPRKRAVKRIPRGERTPQEEFRQPILRALYEMGGSGKTAEVLDRVEGIFGGKLTNADRATLSHGEIRWRNTAQWERNVMVDEGLLKRTSSRGVWELTEKGIKLAERELQDS